MTRAVARAFRLALLAALCASAWAAPAEALIVVEGKVVPAWPEEASARQAKAGTAFAASNLGLYPHPKGVVYGLTLLVDFSDQAPGLSKPQIESWLNQEGYAENGLNGSVRDYFRDNSNGMVDFQNDIFGFYRAKNPKSYYEGGNGYERSNELVDEVLAHFDPLVDFAKYDNDDDGKVDAISLVYAGEAEVFAQGLWPHASGSNQMRDGVRLARYMMTNLGDVPGLYTFSHEVGHMLFGWPDLYGFGNYCIMGNGASQKNPPGINDLYRADQGWIDVVDVPRDTNALYTAELNGTGYRFQNPGNSEESFFWSNVQSSGRFATIEGDGLLLLHFDKGIGRNDPPNLLSLAVVQADGKKELDQTTWPEPGSDADDFFTGAGVDEFSAKDFETAKWNDGSASGLRIYEVGNVATGMPFKVGNGAIVVEPSAGAGGVGGGLGGGGLGGHSGTTTVVGSPGGFAAVGQDPAGSGGAAGNAPVSVTLPPGSSGGTVEGSCACRQSGASSPGNGAWTAVLALLAALSGRRGWWASRRPARRPGELYL